MRWDNTHNSFVLPTKEISTRIRSQTQTISLNNTHNFFVLPTKERSTCSHTQTMIPQSYCCSLDLLQVAMSSFCILSAATTYTTTSTKTSINAIKEQEKRYSFPTYRSSLQYCRNQISSSKIVLF
jgi:hypothetical protein